MTDKHKTLENWFVGQIMIPDELVPVVPIIRGFVDGKFIKFAPLLWFDSEKKIVMTDDAVYKMGEPNQSWLMTFLAEGHTIEDLEINDTIH